MQRESGDLDASRRPLLDPNTVASRNQVIQKKRLLLMSPTSERSNTPTSDDGKSTGDVDN